MVGQPALKKGILLALSALFAVISIAFLLMWPLRFYTTLGIDLDRREGDRAVYYSYYRIRWPGDGAFIFGGGAHHYTYGTKRLEPFDLGGRFFLKARPEPVHSLWNRLGFHWTRNEYEDKWSLKESSLKKPWQFWIGVPSGLPALVFGLFAWFCWRACKRPEETIPAPST
jgi:hypothetical protein